MKPSGWFRETVSLLGFSVAFASRRPSRAICSGRWIFAFYRFSFILAQVRHLVTVYSTVTLLARLRGLSTSVPLATAA
ncbi:hypothetical protein JCM13210_22850 [Thermaerobacter litoralis]